MSAYFTRQILAKAILDFLAFSAAQIANSGPLGDADAPAARSKLS
jgi:hypothetical protein